MLIDNLEYCRDAVALHKLSKKVLGSSKANKKEVVEALAGKEI